MTFLSKAFFLSQAQDQLCGSAPVADRQTFIRVPVNAVMRHQGINLVYVEPKGKNRGFAQSIVKGVSKPLNRFSKEGMLRYLVSLPLNLVPVVGTVLFLLYNG